MVVTYPCIIIIHHEARKLVLTWVLNYTAVAAIQLFLLNEFVSHLSEFEKELNVQNGLQIFPSP